MAPTKGPNGKNPPISAHKELITVARAKELLARNKNNRPLSARTVRRYADEMKAGLWKFNGEPLILTADGKELLNGQHRLNAIISSGLPQPMLVVWGVERSAFDTMDVGKKREAGDMLGIIGMQRTRVLAAVARTLITYESGTLWTTDKEAAGSSDLSKRPTEAQVVQYVMEHPELDGICELVGTKYVKGGKLATPSTLASLAVLMMRQDKVKATAFLDGFAGLIPCWGSFDPRFMAREYFIRMKMQKSWRPRDGHHLAVLIKAANAHFEDKALRRLSFARTREWYPRFGESVSESEE